jgi:hypothetical protein
MKRDFISPRSQVLSMGHIYPAQVLQPWLYRSGFVKRQAPTRKAGFANGRTMPPTVRISGALKIGLVKSGSLNNESKLSSTAHPPHNPLHVRLVLGEPNGPTPIMPGINDVLGPHPEHPRA